MNIILIAVIVCCLVSLVFSICNKYPNVTPVLTHFSTCISFIIALISFAHSHKVIIVEVIISIYNVQTPDIIILSLAMILCYLSFSIIMLRRQIVFNFETGMYGALLIIPQMTLPIYILVIITVIFLLPALTIHPKK